MKSESLAERSDTNPGCWLKKIILFSLKGEYLCLTIHVITKINKKIAKIPGINNGKSPNDCCLGWFKDFNLALSLYVTPAD